jgi:hypothetical protein
MEPWADILERGDAAEVTVADVRRALADRRGDGSDE